LQCMLQRVLHVCSSVWEHEFCFHSPPRKLSLKKSIPPCPSTHTHTHVHIHRDCPTSHEF
jgi:hypothetical protein